MNERVALKNWKFNYLPLTIVIILGMRRDNYKQYLTQLSRNISRNKNLKRIINNCTTLILKKFKSFSLFLSIYPFIYFSFLLSNQKARSIFGFYWIIND